MSRNKLTVIVLSVPALCLLGVCLAGHGRVGPWWRAAEAPASTARARAVDGSAAADRAEAGIPQGLSIELAEGVITRFAASSPDWPTSKFARALGCRYAPGDLDATDVTPELWRAVEAVVHEPDGGLVNIRLLRPLWWLEANGIGGLGEEFRLSVPEMGVAGTATVLGIGPCRVDSRRNGRGAQIVIGTFERESADVHDMHVEGEPDPIGVTGSHPFWSVDRRDWVVAGELRPGERLAGKDRVLRVVRLARRSGRHKVYNLEVHREHAYRVGRAGLLVHNNSLGDRMIKAGRYGDPGTNAHHIVARNHPGASDAQKVLRECGIDLDDAINGVWLPRNSTVSRARGALHHEAGSALTNDTYLKEVNKRITTAAKGGRAQVLRELQKIRHDLLNGTFPGTRMNF
ncbi:MAG: AHH domain-containing protein [Planctomycetota bacterium]|jgi:hypothetical protein